MLNRNLKRPGSIHICTVPKYSALGISTSPFRRIEGVYFYQSGTYLSISAPSIPVPYVGRITVKNAPSSRNYNTTLMAPLHYNQGTNNCALIKTGTVSASTSVYLESLSSISLTRLLPRYLTDFSLGSHIPHLAESLLPPSPPLGETLDDLLREDGDDGSWSNPHDGGGSCCRCC